MAEWGGLDVTGAAGPIGNVFLRQSGTRLAVVLPGLRRGWTTPAVYYPVLGLLELRFDALCLDSIYDRMPARERLLEDATAAVRAGRAAGEYEQVLLAGKSLGTLGMAELLLRDSQFTGSSTIWLTPLLRDDRVAAALGRLDVPALVVIGSEDAHYDTEVLSGLEARGHRVLVLAGAHHGLAIEGDARGSAEIPRQLVEAVLDYQRDSRSAPAGT